MMKRQAETFINLITAMSKTRGGLTSFEVARVSGQYSGESRLTIGEVNRLFRVLQEQGKVRFHEGKWVLK